MAWYFNRWDILGKKRLPLQIAQGVCIVGCVGEEVRASFEPARVKEEPAPTQVLVYQMQVIAATSLLFLAVSNPTIICGFL